MACKRLLIRSAKPSAFVLGLTQRLASIGVSVKEMIPESSTVTAMVIANSRKSRPINPDIKIMGINAAIRLKVIERMVTLISLAASMAASKGVFPISMWRAVFSKTTIASSMRNPIERVIASIERMSKENPQSLKMGIAPRTERGRVSVATRESFGLPRAM